MTVTEIRGGTRTVEASQERIAQYTENLDATVADRLTETMRALQPDTTEPYPVPSEGAFEIENPEAEPDAEPEYEEFLAARDLEKIGGRHIAAYPDDFKHLRDVRIVYRWKHKGASIKGNPTLGYCEKLSPKLVHFAGAEFMIWAAADNLRLMRATERQVEALIFHELCHIVVKDSGSLGIIGHDLEMFNREVQAYGAWKRDLKLTQRTFAQLPLDGVR